MTADWRAKISKALKGNTNALGCTRSTLTRLKMAASQYGNRNAAGNTNNLGRKWPAEVRAKMAAAHRGKIVSDETRAKLSKVMKGNKHCLGKKHTIETRRRMSIAIRASYVRRKQQKLQTA